MRLSDDAYNALLTDLRAIITTGRGRAAVAVNAELVMTYWKIGERIVREEQGGREHAGYGTRLLARLGRTLNQEFGRALNERNLQQMRQFYVTYPNANVLRSELTWTHYRTLMRLPSERRVFYEQLTATGRWSSRELERQINSMLYSAPASPADPRSWSPPSRNRAALQRHTTRHSAIRICSMCAVQRHIVSLSERGGTRRNVPGPPHQPDAERHKGKQHVRKAENVRKRCRIG